MLKRLHSNTTQRHHWVGGERTEKPWWRSVVCTHRQWHDEHSRQIHLLRLQVQLLGCCGSAVQGLHLYGSVVDGAGRGGSERTKRVHHRGSGRMAVRDPWPLRGLRPQLQLGRASLSASPRLWVLDEPLQCYICTQGHHFMTRAGSIYILTVGSLPMLSFSLQETE